MTKKLLVALVALTLVSCASMRKETAKIAIKVSNTIQQVYDLGVDVFDLWCAYEEKRCQKAEDSTGVDVDCDRLKLCKEQRVEFMTLIKKAQSILLNIDKVLTAEDFLKVMDIINDAKSLINQAIKILQERGVIDGRVAENPTEHYFANR